MAKLIIKRKSEYNNRWRPIGLYIDGNKIGTIENGEFKEFDIETGTHQLKAKIDWCGSQPLTFTLTDDEVQKIELSGFKFYRWMMVFVFLPFLFYYLFKVRLELDPLFFLGVSFPFFLYIGYYLTFGRNHYLRLKKVNFSFFKD